MFCLWCILILFLNGFRFFWIEKFGYLFILLFMVVVEDLLDNFWIIDILIFCRWVCRGTFVSGRRLVCGMLVFFKMLELGMIGVVFLVG